MSYKEAHVGKYLGNRINPLSMIKNDNRNNLISQQTKGSVVLVLHNIFVLSELN